MSDEQVILQKIRARPTLSELMQERSLQETQDYLEEQIGTGRAEFHFCLSELHILTDELEKASECLRSLAEQMPALGQTCKLYQDVIEADRWRREWHRDGERSPSSFTTPPTHLKLRCKGWHEYHQRTVKHALQSLKRADKHRPRVPGVLESDKQDTHRFSDVRESDSFLCDALEVLSPKKFFLVPFEQIKRLELPKAESQRQFAYVTTRLVTYTGQDGLVWIPQYYAGTHFSEDDESRVGRLTTWEEVDDDFVVAFGPRKLHFFCDESQYLMGLDQIVRIAFSREGAGKEAQGA